VKGVSWSAVSQLGTQCFTWVISIILARILGPKAYGLLKRCRATVSSAGQREVEALNRKNPGTLSVQSNENSCCRSWLRGLAALALFACSCVSVLRIDVDSKNVEDAMFATLASEARTMGVGRVAAEALTDL
jgi:hypothetical protein